jgi:hypothetical protein
MEDLTNWWPQAAEHMTATKWCDDGKLVGIYHGCMMQSAAEKSSERPKNKRPDSIAKAAAGLFCS